MYNSGYFRNTTDVIISNKKKHKTLTVNIYDIISFEEYRLFSDCTFLIENGFHLGSDHLGWDVCVNFIKTIFQMLRNDVIDNINQFNLATVFARSLPKWKPFSIRNVQSENSRLFLDIE
jgi:hypothetical protein